MEKESESIDIYFVIQPIVYFAKFCGLWPQTLKVKFFFLIQAKLF